MQVIEVLPKKNRIKVNVSGESQYYQLRALQRALPSVVVKVIFLQVKRITMLIELYSGYPYHPTGDHQCTFILRRRWSEGG